MAVPNGIVVFGYPYSPYARKVKTYLALRNIHYAECIQPPIMPRPDLSALGVQYRRIPVVAIGRDIYVDTRAIIKRLDELYPDSPEHPSLSSPEAQGLASLLNNFVGNTGGLFTRATSLITPEWGLMKDPKFQKDRSEFFGSSYFKGGWKDAKKEGIVHMRLAFGTVEALLQDRRQWIAGTKELSSADAEIEWVLDFWINDLRAPKDFFSESEYPKTFAWIARFREVLSAATKRAQKPVRVKGDEALQRITDADYTDSDLTVDANDPVQLEKNTLIALFPTDGGGPGHHDRGELVKLTRDEVAIQTKASNGKDVRIHAPRWNFRIKPVEEKAKL